MDNVNSSATEFTPIPPLSEASRIWAKIGFLSFGGPAAQIALMHRLIVDEMKWLTEKEYLNALSFCMLLPGPEAMQLATYAGWRLHGIAGGLIAGLLFVIPGAVIILLLAGIYASIGNIPLVEALFLGIKSAVLIVVIQALLRIAGKSLKQTRHRIIALISFVGIFFLDLPFPVIIIGAACFGMIGNPAKNDSSIATPVSNGGIRRLAMTVVLMLGIWWLPLFAIDTLSEQKILVDMGEFFSRLAVVTFGGAYAVLAYMGQDVVNHWGWLSAGEMMDGLGLAETTPGPLILVTEFVGYIAAYREGGVALGIAGALVTLWVTFVPCFLWIFAGAPYIEWICAQPRLKGALSSISAAVVGVILNLSLWFSLHVLFAKVTRQNYGVLTLWQPDLGTIDWRVAALTAFCGYLSFKLRWSIQRILIVSALAGAVVSYF
jgi:chromate transporter